MAIGSCVKNFSVAVVKAIAASPSNCRPLDDQTAWHSIWVTTGYGGRGRSPGPRFESLGQPHVELCDPPFLRVQESPVEWDNRIPQSRRPFVLEDDQTGDEISYSSFPWSHREDRSLRISETWSPCRQYGDTVSAGVLSFGPGSYCDGWRGANALLPCSCQPTL